MDNFFKQEVIGLIIKAIGEIGSGNKLAKKLGVNNGTLSNMVSGKDKSISPEMWQKVASGLGYAPKEWKIAEIKNYKMMMETLDFARQHGQFAAISNVAGSGKTATLKSYQNFENEKAVRQYKSDSKKEKEDYSSKTIVYVISAREWNRRQFLLKLVDLFSVNIAKGKVQTADLEDNVIDACAKLILRKPILIIDEADKLRPSALRFLIPFFNDLENKFAVVLVGTDNLKKEIKSRAANSIKGYDEIDSRIGRNYIRPYGIQQSDFKAICEVNGLFMEDSKFNLLWRSLEPKIIYNVNKDAKVKEEKEHEMIELVDDIRRIKRVVLREQFKLQRANEG